jgi:hypothetical protein
MKKRLKEMEDEAAALREMQAKVEMQMGSTQGFLSFSVFFFFFFFFQFIRFLIYRTPSIFFNAISSVLRGGGGGGGGGGVGVGCIFFWYYIGFLE